MSENSNVENEWSTENPKEYFEQLGGGARAVRDELERLSRNLVDSLPRPAWPDGKAPVASADVAGFLNCYVEGIQAFAQTKALLNAALEHYDQAEKNGDFKW